MKSYYLKNNLGKTYKLVIEGHLGPEGFRSKNLRPLNFDDPVSTQKFLRHLSVPSGLQRKLANLADAPAYVGGSNDPDSIITQLLIKNRIQIYELPVDIGKHMANPALQIKGKSRERFEFAPVQVLLINTRVKTRDFMSESEAVRFLDQLEPDVEQLEKITSALELRSGKSATTDYTSLVNTLADGIVSGDIVVIENSAPNRSELKGDNDTSSENILAVVPKPHSLGPHVGNEVAAGLVLTQDKPIECGVCTVSSFKVNCKHDRVASLIGKLRVVPEQTSTRARSVKLMGVEVEIKEEFGGKENITGVVSLEGAKRSDCAKNNTGDGWKTGAKSSLVINGQSGGKLDIWPVDVSPEVFVVSSKGCSGSAAQVTVESFPNQKYTIEGKLDIFKDWVEGVNEAWKKWGEKVFNYLPVSLEPKITGPTGSFSASWGWKEDKDWKAYFDFTASFGLNPILGVGIEISLSVVKLLGTAAGIPPVFSKLAADHLADVLFIAGADSSASLIGSPHAMKYPDGSFLASGDAKFTAEGLVKLALKVRAGSDYIVSVALIAKGETRIKGEDSLDLNRDGLFAQTTIILEPLAVTVRVEYKYMVIFTKSKEDKWTPWKEMELYKSDVKKIFPE